jgi:hypothetical protein
LGFEPSFSAEPEELELDERFFPEPDAPRQKIYDPARRDSFRKRTLRLVTTILFCALCLGMVVGASIFALNRYHESPAYSRSAYSVQSPTMTPGPGDSVNKIWEEAG